MLRKVGSSGWNSTRNLDARTYRTEPRDRELCPTRKREREIDAFTTPRAPRKLHPNVECRMKSTYESHHGRSTRIIDAADITSWLGSPQSHLSLSKTSEVSGLRWIQAFETLRKFTRLVCIVTG